MDEKQPRFKMCEQCGDELRVLVESKPGEGAVFSRACCKEPSLWNRAIDAMKEFEDRASYWMRLISEAEAVRGPGAYASFNIGTEDVKNLLRYRALLSELVDNLPNEN